MIRNRNGSREGRRAAKEETVQRAALVLVCCAGLLAACTASPSSSSATKGRVEVVAAESPWGSVAAAVGGDHVVVLVWLQVGG